MHTIGLDRRMVTMMRETFLVYYRLQSSCYFIYKLYFQCCKGCRETHGEWVYGKGEFCVGTERVACRWVSDRPIVQHLSFSGSGVHDRMRTVMWYVWVWPSHIGVMGRTWTAFYTCNQIIINESWRGHAAVFSRRWKGLRWQRCKKKVDTRKFAKQKRRSIE